MSNQLPNVKICTLTHGSNQTYQIKHLTPPVIAKQFNILNVGKNNGNSYSGYLTKTSFTLVILFECKSLEYKDLGKDLANVNCFSGSFKSPERTVSNKVENSLTFYFT
jgi:hypothetical protein